MSVFYTGFNPRRRVVGSIKLGEVHTANSPAQRFKELRKTEPSWEPFYAYIKMPNATKAETWIVESTVRLIMERIFPELENVGNDHFEFPITDNKNTQIEKYCLTALAAAKKTCEKWHISYEVVMKQYKRKY